MKIVLHLEVDEEEISLYPKDRKEISKLEIQKLLMEELNDQMNAIVDWCEVYEFKEDRRDRKRKE